MAPGAHATVTFDYVLTAADFARGTVTYAAQLDADGLTLPTHAAPAVVSGITFQAYQADVDGVTEGGITVCDANGKATDSVTQGETYEVTPGACGYGGDPAGYRVVAFSTPTLLASDSFDATIPGGLAAGAHRLAVYAPDGALVGWRAVTVAEPIAYSGRLASTGSSSDEVTLMLAWAAALLVLGSTVAATAGLRPRRGGVG